jgi:hypothetical protein
MASYLYSIFKNGVPYHLQRKNYRADTIRIVKTPNLNNANRFNGIITKTFPENDRFVIDDIVKVTTVDQTVVSSHIDQLNTLQSQLSFTIGATSAITVGCSAALYTTSYPLLCMVPAVTGSIVLFVGIKRLRSTNFELKSWRKSLINRFIEKRVRCTNMESHLIYKKGIINRYMLPIEAQNIWRRQFLQLKIKVDNFDYMTLDDKTKLLEDIFKKDSVLEKNITDYFNIFSSDKREKFYKSYLDTKFIFENVRQKYDARIKQLNKNKHEYKERVKKELSDIQKTVAPGNNDNIISMYAPISATYANKYAQLYADLNHEYEKQIAEARELESNELIQLIPLVRGFVNYAD